MDPTVARRRTSRLALVLGMTALFALPAVPAFAVTTCTFSGTTAAITMPTNQHAYIERSVSAIHVNGSPCQGATVTNTDTITVATGNGTQSNRVTISHDGGRFEPGATIEGSGTSEIEFQIDQGDGADELRFVGVSGVDNVVLGLGGGTYALNLNADESPDDADVQNFYNSDLVTMYGRGGDDKLRAAGGSATGARYNNFLVLSGGAQNDTLRGGDGRNALVGGADSDTIYGGSFWDQIQGGTGADHIYGGPESDTINGNAGADKIWGGSGGDDIIGGPGHDELYGQGQIDTLDAQDGMSDIGNAGPPSAAETCLVDSIDSIGGC